MAEMGKDEFVQKVAERLARMPKDTAPTGEPYHLLEAATAGGELTGELWMEGPEGGLPVFQSRADALTAVRCMPLPQEMGFGENAERWHIRALSGDELRYFYLNPHFTVYVVLKVNDDGIETRPL
ncbi:hypothetical protein D7V97_31885 [Corallococcus sp. CA053C]|uniref:hypothetical protein n=1 Tax=Corallococcus sp. CA053C TaxID=2316732 RepID=UPI000EA32F1C|nr:hypothetical protein [Corallococcus sp. CA053C]RKG99282.1 hypothetical protein D7V97_31885 [Corallococcus sp. CA053C]